MVSLDTDITGMLNRDFCIVWLVKLLKIFFAQDTCAFSSNEDQIGATCTFRVMSSKVVGFHQDATELLGLHKSNRTLKSISVCPAENVTLVWPLLQGHLSPWFWWWIAGAKWCQAQSDITLCLQSTNRFRVLCGPVQSASLGKRDTLVALWMVTNMVPQTAKLSSAGSEARKLTNPRYPRALSGVKPALKSCATSSDPWRPALTSK